MKESSKPLKNVSKAVEKRGLCAINEHWGCFQHRSGNAGDLLLNEVQAYLEDNRPALDEFIQLRLIDTSEIGAGASWVQPTYHITCLIFPIHHL